MILGKTQASLVGTANATANSTDRIRESFWILIEKVATPFADAFDESAGDVMKSMERLADFIETLAPKIKTGMEGIFNAISDAASGNFERLKQIGKFMGQALALGFRAGAYSISIATQRIMEDVNPIRKSEDAYQRRFEAASPEEKRRMARMPDHNTMMAGGYRNRGSDKSRAVVDEELKDDMARLADEFRVAMAQAQYGPAQERLMELREQLRALGFHRLHDPEKIEGAPWLKDMLREIQELKKILNAPAN